MKRSAKNYHFPICKNRPKWFKPKSPLKLDLDAIFLCRELVFQGTISWPSIKLGTRNIPEHAGTLRNIPEHEKIKIIFMKKKNEIE